VKIIFVCGAGIVSGKEIITLALIDGFRARGHEVRCVTSRWAAAEFIRELETRSTPYIRVPFGFISKTFSWHAMRLTIGQILELPRLWFQYARYLRDFRPDVVVQTNFHHTIILWPVLNRRNTIFHVHDSFLQTAFYRRVFRFLNRRLCAFVGVSNFIKQMIVDLGVPEAKVFAVLNGIELSPVEGASPQTTMPANAHRSNGSVTIGIVGQVGAWKGHDDFIEALKELRQSRIPFQGIIFGSGDQTYVAALKEKIAQYHLDPHIHWAGFVRNTREIFAATDICVVPSRSQDPCPTVALEAAHCGVPLVATRRGGLPELVRDGETGYLVEAESPKEIAEKLRGLIEDAGLRRRISQAAKSHGAEYLTRDRMVSEMEAVFEKTVRLMCQYPER
jgi:glycosyltransferase involved in cell wall biosynthesis